MASDLGPGLHDVHILEAAFAQDHRTFEPGAAGADDQEAGVAVRGRRVVLGMPAALVLLAGRGVLGAQQGPPKVDPRHAGVAADALPNVLESTLLDLAGKERIGDRGSGRPDDVELATGDRLQHRVRAGEPAHAHDGLAGVGANLADPFGLEVLLVEPCRSGILDPQLDVLPSDLEIPEVDEVVGQLDESHALLRDPDPGVCAMEGIDTEPGRHR